MTPLTAALLVFAMEMASALISLLIGYYASKAYRASSARGLLFLYLGFAILGIGILLRAITAIYLTLANRVVDTAPGSLVQLSNVAGIVFSVTQLVAYALFIASYVYQHRGSGEWDKGLVAVPALLPFPAAIFPVAKLFYIPALEIVAIAMLGFVAYSSLVNWRHRRTPNSALVFSGFGLMFASHVLYLFMIFNEYLLFYGQAVQLVGFLCMLLMLVRVNRINAQGT